MELIIIFFFKFLYSISLFYICMTGIRPSSARPSLVRHSAIPPKFDSSESSSTSGSGGFRPKFPPRPTRPSGQVRDNTKGGADENEDLISLIPIDRPSNKPGLGTTKIDDNLREDEDDPRVLTGGPFIPNFGGGLAIGLSLDNSIAKPLTPLST